MAPAMFILRSWGWRPNHQDPSHLSMGSMERHFDSATDNISCFPLFLYVRVYAEAKEDSASSSTCLSYSLETESRSEHTAHHFSQAGWPLGSQYLPVSVPQCWGYKYTQHPSICDFCRSAGNLNSSLHAYMANWSISPALLSVFDVY